MAAWIGMPLSITFEITRQRRMMRVAPGDPAP